jgi:capsular exopolysaccharide synthesis family protein
MGRVDEAMKRAAQGRFDPVDPPAAERSPLEAPDAFPREVGQRPGAADAAPVAASAPLRPVTPRADDSRSGSSILDRLGVDLSRKTMADRDTDPISREQYRRLAATLHAAQAASNLKVIMVASALANEGKTLTATNLALTFSESYQRNVLLIDGDLRKPSLDSVFNVDSRPGLNDVLAASDDRALPIHHVSPHLSLLTAGRASADPMAGLVSARARDLIDDARARFDWVIIDTPPIGLLSDANLLSAMADGTLFVVRAGATPYELVQRAIETIGRGRILGVVLNRVTSLVAGLDQKYYGGYYGTRRSDIAGRG